MNTIESPSNRISVDSPANDHSSVDVELLTLGKILSVVKGQVAEASSDIEGSVLGVCQGFQGMARQATEAVNAASSSLSADRSGSGHDLIGEMQVVLQSLVQNIRESSQFADSVSSRLAKMESRLATIEKRTRFTNQALKNRASNFLCRLRVTTPWIRSEMF